MRKKSLNKFGTIPEEEVEESILSSNWSIILFYDEYKTNAVIMDVMSLFYSWPVVLATVRYPLL